MCDRYTSERLCTCTWWQQGRPGARRLLARAWHCQTAPASPLHSSCCSWQQEGLTCASSWLSCGPWIGLKYARGTGRVGLCKACSGAAGIRHGSGLPPIPLQADIAACSAPASPADTRASRGLVLRTRKVIGVGYKEGREVPAEVAAARCRALPAGRDMLISSKCRYWGCVFSPPHTIRS